MFLIVQKQFCLSLLGNGSHPSNFRKSIKDNPSDKRKKFGPELLFKKLLNIGESFLSKFPLKKIVPILKRSENRNFLWITFFTIKFVKILKERTFVAKYNKLSDNHFKMISDNSKVVGTYDKLSRKITLSQRSNHLLRKKVLLFKLSCKTIF